MADELACSDEHLERTYAQGAAAKDWKHSKCGECEFWIPGERRRQAAVIDKHGFAREPGILLDGPRNGVCRESPPSVIVVGGQQTPQGMALMTQGQYPPVSDSNEACSRFVKALNLVEA